MLLSHYVDRVLGRVCCNDIVDPDNGAIIAVAGSMIDEHTLDQIDASNI